MGVGVKVAVFEDHAQEDFPAHDFVALGDGDDEVGKVLALAAAELAHHAEVEEADDVARHDQDIAGMGIGVEVAVFKDHAQDQVESALADELFVVSAAVEFLALRGFDAFHVFHGQHAVGGKVVIDFRDMDPFIFQKHSGKALDVGGLHAIVDFILDRAGEFFHDAGGIVQIPSFHMALHEGGDVEHDFNVDLDHFADVGPLDLDDNPLAAF